MAVAAGGGQTIVDPQRAHRLLFLEDRVDVLVDQAILAVSHVVAHEVGTAELVVAVDEHHRTAGLGGHVQCKRGLSGAGRTRKVDRIAGFEVGGGPLDQLLDLGSDDKAVAGFGLNVVGAVRELVVQSLAGLRRCCVWSWGGGFLSCWAGRKSGGLLAGLVSALQRRDAAARRPRQAVRRRTVDGAGLAQNSRGEQVNGSSWLLDALGLDPLRKMLPPVCRSVLISRSSVRTWLAISAISSCMSRMFWRNPANCSLTPCAMFCTCSRVSWNS